MLYAQLDNELGIPADALDVDIISFKYRMVGNKMLAYITSKHDPVYHILNFKVYRNENKFCLATDEEVYGFDLSEVEGIKCADKGMYTLISKYDKKVEKIKKLNLKKFFWEYKVPLYLMKFTHDGEEWTLYFPYYEIPVFEKITGLKAE